MKSCFKFVLYRLDRCVMPLYVCHAVEPCHLRRFSFTINFKVVSQYSYTDCTKNAYELL